MSLGPEQSIPPYRTLGQQWERRTRSVSGAMHVFMRRKRQLGPAGGIVAAQIWGHRLARYTIAPVAHVALLAVAMRRARTSRLAVLFLSGHLVALWGLARKASVSTVLGPESSRPDDPGNRAAEPRSARSTAWGRLADALGQAVFLNAVALGGLVRYLRGDRQTQWPVVRRPKRM